MRVFSTVSIKARILSIFALLSLLYLLLLGMVQVTSVATHRSMKSASELLFPAALKMQSAETDFAHMNQFYKDSVVMEDGSGLNRADEEAEKVAGELAAVSERVATFPKLRDQAEDLRTKIADYNTRSHRTYEAMMTGREGGSGQLQAEARTLAGESSSLDKALSDLDAAITVTFRGELHELDEWSLRSSSLGWVMLLLTGICCAGGWYFLQHEVVVPLRHLAGRLRDIAEGDGDLTHRVEVQGTNELDEVGKWFNVFIAKIEEIVQRVMQTADRLAAGSNSLAGIARENASESTLQQNQAQMITVSMGEISAAVANIGSTTQAAARNALRAEEQARNGGTTIRSTVLTIQQTLQASQVTAARIEELGRASNAIGAVTRVIDRIANQTNLLALNASIEAARAGVHGRGFSVVADEIRRLADSTRDATQEISLKVEGIQGEIIEVVRSMQESMGHVEGGVSSALTAGETLDSIIRGAEGVQKMITHIAGASDEQTQATHAVHENLHEIVTIIERTSASSARAVEACDGLSVLASDLIGLVGSFKVHGTEVDCDANLTVGAGFAQ